MDLNKTDRKLRKLKPRATSYTEALGEGILCRVSPNGTRVLELRARLFGTVRRYLLGHYPATTISEAAARAAEYRAMLKNGIDPKIVEQRAADEDLPKSVGEAASRFISGHLSVKTGAKWGGEVKRIFEADILPKLGGHPLRQVTRTDLTSLIDKKYAALRKNGGRGIAANRLAAVLGKFFGWCWQQGWIATDLGAKLPKPAKEQAKDRMLQCTDSNNEIGAIWNALREAAENPGTILQSHARIMVLLAITGARCGEITNLTSTNIDLKAGTISITDAKNDASNRILPIAPGARAIIEAQMAEVGQGLLFPGPRAGKLIASNEISRSCRKLVKLLKLTPFTPHDLRRTAISIMAEAGVDGDIRRRVTGHQAPDIHGRVYDRALRLEDMKKALTVIETAYSVAALEATKKSGDSNIITLKGRGRQ